MKLAAHYYGVKVPAFVFAYDDDGIEQASTLNFPLIVKHFNGSGSVGMTRNSKVNTKEELYEQARRMIKKYHVLFFVEITSQDLGER